MKGSNGYMLLGFHTRYTTACSIVDIGQNYVRIGELSQAF